MGNSTAWFLLRGFGGDRQIHHRLAGPIQEALRSSIAGALPGHTAMRGSARVRRGRTPGRTVGIASGPSSAAAFPDRAGAETARRADHEFRRGEVGDSDFAGLQSSTCAALPSTESLSCIFPGPAANVTRDPRAADAAGAPPPSSPGGAAGSRRIRHAAPEYGEPSGATAVSDTRAGCLAAGLAAPGRPGHRLPHERDPGLTVVAALRAIHVRTTRERVGCRDGRERRLNLRRVGASGLALCCAPPPPA